MGATRALILWFNFLRSNLYDKSERNSEHGLMVMRNIIMNYTVLFVGTGMGDYQIESLFNEIKSL